MRLIHIGLGKTATTTLQRNVFPELARAKSSLLYHSPTSMVSRLCLKHHYCGLTAAEWALLNEQLSHSDDTLVSCEALVSWNPALWELAAEKNLELFGADSVVLVTIRETASYLRSVYQQMVQVGNVKRPEDFFVREDYYRKIESFLSPIGVEYFNVDAFDLRKLFRIYENRFKRVHFVPLTHLSSLNFLQTTFTLDAPTICALRRSISRAPNYNRSYSSLAMEMTFWRERIFELLGAKSRGTRDRTATQLFERYSVEVNRLQGRRKPPMPLRLKQVASQLPARALRRVSWRRLMQEVVDRYIPYRSYHLPKQIAWNQELVMANNQFLQECSNVINES